MSLSDFIKNSAIVGQSGGGGSPETFSIIGTGAVSTVLLLTDANAGVAATPTSVACTAMFFHKSPVPWEYQLNGAGNFYKVRANERKLIRGITNANQVGVRRQDYATQSAKASPVTDTSQVQTLTYELGNVSNASITVANLTKMVGTSSNAAFGSYACAAMELNNSTPKDVIVKVNAYARIWGTLGSGGAAPGVFTATAVSEGFLYPGQTMNGSGMTTAKVVAQLTSTEPGGALGLRGTYQTDGTQVLGTSTFTTFNTPDAGFILQRNETRMFTGLLNAAQISVQTFSSSAGTDIQAEAFSALPTLARREYVIAESVGRDAVTMQGELTIGAYPGAEPDVFTVPASFTPKTQFNRAGRHISMFNTAANTVVTSATVADVTIADDSTSAFTSRTGGNTPVQVQVTIASGASATIMSLLNTPIPLDASGGLFDIHESIKLLSGTCGAVAIDLFSAGTPASPGANYHTLDIYGDLKNGFSPAYGFSARSFSAHLFTPVGAGANMAALTMIRWRITASIGGCVVSPEGTKIVRKGSSRATDIYTSDDGYSSLVTYGAPLLSPYGRRAVIYPSPAYQIGVNTLGANGSMTIDNYRSLQDDFGYQIAMQEFRSEPSTDMTVTEWVRSLLKNKTAMVSFGFSPEGLDDCSRYGGGTYGINNVQQKAFTRVGASSRTFTNGTGSLGCAFMATISGTAMTVQSVTSGALAVGQIVVAAEGAGVGDNVKITAGSGTSWTISGTASVATSTAMAADANPPLKFCDTNPPGDPFSLTGFNVATYSTTNALLLYAKYKLYLDQAIASKGIAVFSAHNDWANTTINTALGYLLAYAVRQDAAGNLQNRTLVELRKQQSTAALRAA